MTLLIPIGMIIRLEKAKVKSDFSPAKYNIEGVCLWIYWTWEHGVCQPTPHLFTLEHILYPKLFNYELDTS